MKTLPEYAELHAISNFTFLRGASHPEELVRQAHALGYRALAVTDECSLAGIVRAHVEARELGFNLICGSEFTLDDNTRLVLLAPDRRAYGELSALITHARRAADKGEYHATRDDVARHIQSCLALWLPAQLPLQEEAEWLGEVFGDRAWIAASRCFNGRDRKRMAQLAEIGAHLNIPLVASGEVYFHARERRPLQDVLTAIRLRQPVDQLKGELQANAEHYLRSRSKLQKLFPAEYLQQTIAIAERCTFSLDTLRYEYPEEIVHPGETPTNMLRKLTYIGIERRWPGGASRKVLDLVEHELKLISELNYEPYFLTVYDIVRFARSQNILCQGRGSAANSAVCFCLGITEVDPSRAELLFERFISKERNEPPDIDVDFENARREEVIQYIYNKYSRERAALAATVITYRKKSAVRDVGKALGMSLDQVDRLSSSIKWWDTQVDEERLRESGFDPDNELLHRVLALTHQILGFPRHLSQHVGGFVISRGPLSELVPVENAAMPERTIIQWDKDDLDALGLLKVDCLALGMLTALHKCFDLLKQHRGLDWAMDDIPAEDPQVYQMIQDADTVGVFQIESRAQMAMLPRLKPMNFYDLVIEVAIVRPGPIQGDMVHPYLRRRQGQEPVTYPSEAVRSVLERTLGVPIFQEQVMKLAVVAAGFTPGEADHLRRSMAAWKRKGGLGHLKEKLIDGMVERNYPESFAEQIYRQIEGFADYGFPESHAASFALLAYVSAWFKYHEPAVFTCALLNSQPMGFYAPSQLVQDARRHGVTVLPVDVCYSEWDSTLEPDRMNRLALRLGMHQVKGLHEEIVERIINARRHGQFNNVNDLARRAQLSRAELQRLSAADALATLAGNRHRAQWQALGVEEPLPALTQAEPGEATPLLRRPTEYKDIVDDYHMLGLSLRRHPMKLLRDQLRQQRWCTSDDVKSLVHGSRVAISGIVISRQRPGSATGVVFVTLEDEFGHANVIVWNSLVQSQRKELLNSKLLGVIGEVQRDGKVIHIVAHRLVDLTGHLQQLSLPSRDFR
jgi:error-prone DNA polymerase